MLLDVTNLLRSPGETLPFHFEWTASQCWDGLGEEITWEAPVTLQGECVWMDGFFVVRGEMGMAYTTRCGRCLSPLSVRRCVDFREEFAPREDEDFPDRYLYRGHQLDLTDMAEDLISLHMPMRHLCKEDCKGLCPVCGANRNTTACGCAPQEDPASQKNPFAVLRALQTDEDEEV